MKAADITDQAFVAAVDEIQRERGSWALWGYDGYDEPHILERFPGFPKKVLQAKARRVLKRGFVTGCACGCRGDFEVTEAGREFLLLHEQAGRLEDEFRNLARS